MKYAIIRSTISKEKYFKEFYQVQKRNFNTDNFTLHLEKISLKIL